MTQKDLDRLCKLWQKRLRLQDWKISVRIVPREEIEGTDGQISYELGDWSAEVLIAEGADIEPTLVHELRHIRLDAWVPQTKDEHDAKELTLNIDAECYVALAPKRRKQCKTGSSSGSSSALSCWVCSRLL